MGYLYLAAVLGFHLLVRCEPEQVASTEFLTLLPPPAIPIEATRLERDPTSYILEHVANNPSEVSIIRSPNGLHLCSEGVGILALTELDRELYNSRRLLRELPQRSKIDSVRTLFISGRHKRGNNDRIGSDVGLYAESMMFEDILQCSYDDAEDSFLGLYCGIKWIEENCKSVPYYFYQDGRTIPNWKLLIADSKDASKGWDTTHPMAVAHVLRNDTESLEFPSSAGFLFNQATLRVLVEGVEAMKDKARHVHSLVQGIGDVLAAANISLFNDFRIKVQADDKKNIICDEGDQCPCEEWLSYLPDSDKSYEAAYESALKCQSRAWRSDNETFSTR
eukprot:Protomagalhaensia_wolfi_Nauph_80__922@NODE_152_length_3403_cov_117_267241_g113_i0_p1_GENE_NODE_152_length_3403_cov_117_267241_g113_i0NODE_152_length_3403_cov_117_267241_g113_i0_p1_ORF_typecomplete_len335_score42_82Galactosyl_T/PF01762_21/3_2e07_NODE_152_length_3403_cov_117_267241_g113_i023463350